MEKKEKIKKFDMDSWKEKIGEFFNKNFALLSAPLFVMVLYMVGLIMFGVYPFGNKYTVASYDLSAQICPFIEHLFDVFQGKSTLTYSYAIVGGADVTGTFLYFFISPFSFLFLIFGDGKVAQASSIVMMCKLMTIAFSGAWFAKKVFKDIPDHICIAIGVVYAYCGYMFVSNTYINWVDFLIYMPFCVAAFKHFVKTEKFLPFSILMACCVYTCFSIACFSMFTVFPALVIYGLLCVEKERKIKFIAYLCLSFVVTILISLPVLVPAFAAFLNSARGGDLFENLWYGFNLSAETGLPEEFKSSEFINRFTTSLYAKWSYIVSDGIFVLLTIVWFVRKGVKSNFAKFMLVAGIMTLLPLLVDEAMNLMNMGSYMSYALRFGFLNAVYFLGGACLAIEDICQNRKVQKTEKDGGMSELIDKSMAQKGCLSANAALGILIALALVTVVVAAWFAFGGYNTVWSWLTDDSSILKGLSQFPARFAHSLGGLEVVAVLFVLIALVLVVGLIFATRKKIEFRVFSLIMIVVVGMQVVFYNNMLVAGNCSTQHVGVAHYQTLAAELNARDKEYFRIKDYDDKWTSPVPLSGNANSFSVFSSVIDKDNFVLRPLFGYEQNDKNNFKSTHSSGMSDRTEAFGDAFMGYKYFFVYGDPEGDVSVLEQLRALEKEKDYLKKVTVDGKHLQSGDFYVYENEMVFPLGYRVQGTSFRFADENTGTQRTKNQKALYEYLSGEKVNGNLTVGMIGGLSENLWDKAADVTVSAGKITAKVKNAEEGEALLLNFVASKGYTVTVNGKQAELIENDLKFLNVLLEEGDNEVVFTYSSPYVKYMGFGVIGAILGLCAVAIVVKKTKFMEVAKSVIAWAGIALAVCVVGFFMVFPSLVFITKLLALLL